jgi:hypothetical protein
MVDGGTGAASAHDSVDTSADTEFAMIGAASDALNGGPLGR